MSKEYIKSKRVDVNETNLKYFIQAVLMIMTDKQIEELRKLLKDNKINLTP